MNRLPKGSAVRIGVVIVAFNSDNLLNGCISGALLDPQVSDVVVVDNSSSANSRRVVLERAKDDSRLRYLDPGKNLGFAKGCNEGASAIQGATHYFFVNPDVQLSRPLAALVTHLESTRSAIVTGRLRSPAHPLSVNVRPQATGVARL